MADEKMTKLADPASAIASYLDDLLHTATDSALREEVSVEVPAPEQQVKVQPIEQSVAAPVPEPEPEPEPEPPTPVVAEPEHVEPVTAEPEVEVRHAPEPKPAEQAPLARPDWSEAPLECLIFNVAGLQLAVPLILLGAIHRVEDDSEIRPIPGSPHWYMGIRPDRDQN